MCNRIITPERIPMKKLLATLLTVLLTGCVSGPYVVDKTYQAKGQASRVRFLVLHYTVSDKPASLKTLTEQQVSAHYLVTDDPKPTVYGLVDESRAAYHAGISSWKGYTQLNNSSIGIEIVNPGWRDTPQGRVYTPFPQSQIDVLIPLVKDIVARHKIAPENVIGHSDIAPLRKQDPGPLFPWYQLAQAGVVAWPDANRVAAVRQVFDIQTPDAAWFQKKLASHGFYLTQSGVFDEPTRTVLSAFQMKYRPTNFSGEPDAETAAMLEVLTTPANQPLPPVPPAPVTTMPVPPPPDMPALPSSPVQPEPVQPQSVQPLPPVPSAPLEPVPAVEPAQPA
jgi:N-acetylmuramoyl-L-alanine amidase